MDTQYRPFEVASHIESLRREGVLLADAALRAGLDAPVPACPGWHVRDLLAHLGYVHRWATGYVAGGQAGPVPRLTEGEILSGRPGDETLPGWFSDGHAALVRTLAVADPGLRCWTFLPAPSPLAFWARRQAHETAIHRVDAEQAAGGPSPLHGPLDPRFAIDGIDELIMGFLGRDAHRGTWECPPGVYGFHADDGRGGSAHWRVVSTPSHGEVSRGSGRADCDVTGPAAEVYLLLWNRRPPTGLEVRGDRGLLDGFAGQVRVTWT